jgi:hypothetical protein
VRCANQEVRRSSTSEKLKVLSSVSEFLKRVWLLSSQASHVNTSTTARNATATHATTAANALAALEMALPESGLPWMFCSPMAATAEAIPEIALLQPVTQRRWHNQAECFLRPPTGSPIGFPTKSDSKLPVPEPPVR